jgi:hypothetical protein
MELESILAAIRDRVVGSVDEKSFDNDLIMHVNSAFADLHDLGVGPVDGFEIKDETPVWTDFCQDPPVINSVKEFVYLSVKLVFDPPTQSALLASMERRYSKLEWKLNAKCDSA